MLVVSPIIKASGTRAHKSFYGILPEGAGTWVTDHMGRGRKNKPADPIFPMAHFVEQDPDTHLRPHFHEADQFQVIVAGGGTIGASPIRPLSLHYAGAFTPYGPIVSSAEGVHYFTLRNAWDGGAQYMPESRSRLAARTRPPRSASAGPIAVPGIEALAASRTATVTTVLEPEADGLAVWLAGVPPAETVTPPPQPLGNGQFWIVVSGAADSDHGQLGPHSCIYVSRDEPRPAISAGPQGVAVLILQFPTHP